MFPYRSSIRVESTHASRSNVLEKIPAQGNFSIQINFVELIQTWMK